MATARAALDATPPSVGAVGYLLQAAARSDWIGNPEELIPEHLRGTLDADIGLAEFLRRRELPGWAERTLEMARRHSDNSYFRRIRAVAVLSLAIGSAILVGGHGPVTTAELNDAADELKTVVEKFLDIGFADVRDLIAHPSVMQPFSSASAIGTPSAKRCSSAARSAWAMIRSSVAFWQ